MKRLLPLLACLALPAQAQVYEQLRYQHYDAQVASGESLSRALNAVSPVRQNGQVYHAYTQWRVQWNLWWREERDGRCRLSLVHTLLNAEITLPRLSGGDTQQRQRFEQYLSALQQHELGHYQIGQSAATEIDSTLLSLPEYTSCSELQQQANQQANAILQRHIEQERDYNQNTGHGRSQGAWLED